MKKQQIVSQKQKEPLSLDFIDYIFLYVFASRVFIIFYYYILLLSLGELLNYTLGLW